MDFDGITRLNNEQTFHQEMAWASHLGLQAVLLPSPSIKSPNYSRCILQYCSSTSYQQLWIRIPFHQPLRSDNVDLGYGDVSDGWIAWNNLRVMTGHVHNICVALELNSEISQDDFEFSYKWTAEPVKALILPTNMFLFNKAGYPVLSRIHQDFISIFLKFKIQIVFKGNPRATNSDGLDSNEGYKPYIQYLTYLQDKLKAQLPPEDAFIQGYRDRLQYPLQPLMDNLESQTYETFERDTVKYLQYGRAVISAITYLQKQMLLRNGTKYHNDQQDGLDTIHTTLIITVVGAGRGPLVSAAITAALEVNQSVRIYAVEKNENAIITLRNRVITERWTNVTVIHSDMRDWTPPELAHIMISELLGSWGDNELSPECLDGAQKCLFPDVGISIPMNYTSYLAPVSASRLWTCARDMPIQRDIQSFLDSPFVVKLHNYHQLSRSEPVFHFHHPHSIRDASFIDNRR
jgi:protein arginine N-methyltransferase 5